MKKLFAVLAALSPFSYVGAANVHIIDAGINSSHYPYIQDRIIE